MDLLPPSPAIRLLLVDDDQVDRAACRRVLAKSGQPFAIIEADTAEQGLWLARHEPVDCIVLDHYLPDFNGLEFLVDLAEDRGELPVPVVMLTRANDASVAVRALKLGAADYVVKDSERHSLEWVPAIILKTLRDRQALKEQRETEEAFRKAEAKFRALVEQIPAITYIGSIEEPGRLLYVSPQAGQLGVSTDAWLAAAEGFLPWVHPDDREHAIECFAETHEHHAPLRCEYRLVTPDGQTRWFLDQASVVCAEDGQPLFLQGILVDISDEKAVERELEAYRDSLEDQVAQRTAHLQAYNDLLQAANARLREELGGKIRAEAALRASEARLRLLLESTGDGILGVDAEGRCTFANRAAAELFACRPTELEGRNLAASLPLGRPGRYTETLRRSDGSELPVELSAQPIRTDGGPAGMAIVMRDVGEAHALSERLSHAATHDALTGLWNSVEFRQRVETALAKARHSGASHALCFLDLDHFKQVNETCGHAAGDQMLQSLARLLQSRLRRSDTLARLGGDEFGLLLEDCSPDRAWLMANELREAVRAFRFQWAGETCSVSMSVGLVVLQDALGDAVEALSAADTACYMAKKRGRDRVHILEHSASDLAGKPPAAPAEAKALGRPPQGRIIAHPALHRQAGTAKGLLPAKV
jgi:diguanylate cyclase (GGDEF)-like protein/PAS domain S-box-containing protein